MYDRTTIIIFAGYIAWVFMIFLDPITMDLSDYIAKPLGLLVGLTGLVLFVLSAKAKKGFHELDHLVTEGIYYKIRNPMYLGIILLHVGFPLAAKSLLTLLSAIIWVPLILMWKYWEEKDLGKKFGKEYSGYKNCQDLFLRGKRKLFSRILSAIYVFFVLLSGFNYVSHLYSFYVAVTRIRSSYTLLYWLRHIINMA